MEVHPKKPTAKGPTEWFTGDVWIDGIGQGRGPSPVTIGSVHFTPGARTAWHSHPVGQTLFCLSGVGRICFEGEKPQVLNPGDTVNIPPDTGDFRLLSRRVVEELKRLKESHGFLRGMVASVGFRQTVIVFDRPARFAGQGNYNPYVGSLRIGMNGIICFSNYLLTVSTMEPRKNLPRLMAAFAAVRPKLPEPWPLVVVGPQGWGAAVEAVEGVVLLGRVDDAVLAALYAGARAVAYVPLREGFGLPAVEAMAACVPVVASPIPSTAGAALEVDPLSVDEIAAALLEAVTDERSRSELVNAGLRRATELSWSAAALAHLELWNRLA